jgi:hypothetical protein
MGHTSHEDPFFVEVTVREMYTGLTREEALLGTRLSNSDVNTFRVYCTALESVEQTQVPDGEEDEGQHNFSAVKEDVRISYSTLHIERQTKNGNASFLLYNESFPCWMTNNGVGQTDGFGSQYLKIFAAVAIAGAFKMNFAITLSAEFEHNYENNPDFSSELHRFAGLANAFHSTANLPVIISIRKILQHPMKDWMSSALMLNKECQNTNIQTIYVIESPLVFLDKNPELWNYGRIILRRAYFSTPKPMLTFLAKDVPNVVVFQRRRNRVDTRCTCLPNDYFLAVMKQVRVKWPNAQYHIISQENATTVSCRTFSDCTGGSPYGDLEYPQHVVQGFEDFRGMPATHVLLDLPIQEAFHAIVSADVVIDSPSSFSFAAALLSYGQVWHHTFWHTAPPDTWIHCLWVNGEAHCNK